MKKLKLMLDFGEGSILTEYFDKEKGRLLTGIEKVDNDKELWDINETIQELFASYYYFDYNDQACFFDEKQEKKYKYKMLALLEELKKRLYEINDGSFEIDDRETDGMTIFKMTVMESNEKNMKIHLKITK